jgi:hypothetical protein
MQNIYAVKNIFTLQEKNKPILAFNLLFSNAITLLQTQTTDLTKKVKEVPLKVGAQGPRGEPGAPGKNGLNGMHGAAGELHLYYGTRAECGAILSRFHVSHDFFKEVCFVVHVDVVQDLD